MEGQVDGWMDGWRDGRMGGWTLIKRSLNHHKCFWVQVSPFLMSFQYLVHIFIRPHSQAAGLKSPKEKISVMGEEASDGSG